jgi:putative pyruvate formate lyase activating enzyme
MASKPLERYYAILCGDEKAHYLSTREAKAQVDLSSTTDDLWTVHRGGLSAHEHAQEVSLLQLKTELARRLSSPCTICERRCRTMRSEGKAGHCGVLEARVTSEFLHMGEEPDLVPSYTVFFAGCTFDCVFCQNWDISTKPRSGEVIGPELLAQMIERRCAPAGTARNVNWVGGDPSSNLHYILETLGKCGANTPQVWNSNMYLTEESMALLEGVVDVYLTDFKYGNDDCALRFSNAPEYMRIVTRNHSMARSHAEMIIRHLVLPGHLECCTRPVLTWIASNLSEVKVNVMAQYRPEHRAKDYPQLSRRLRASEYQEAVSIADDLGLEPAD